jgi:hypothetical protein
MRKPKEQKGQRSSGRLFVSTFLNLSVFLANLLVCLLSSVFGWLYT